ncbi:phosphatase regulator like HEAT repeats containing that folds into a alpha-alpha superhelix, partial [Cryptosporidium bovis]|uniref:phosphatase regulator like HEAT repeats containing that folds into a alpha-alpha superhelix n=1 Tax=Cryptosporidium bovis TaxID=310047 RepID=UPI00351A4FCF
EQIKYCHYFCDQCPIGMVGYFSSLKVRIDESIGKEIPDADLLKLAVSLIKTTILSYNRGKLNYEKSKILLISCKEILEIIFYFRRDIESAKSNSINVENERIQVGINFFVNNCTDELVSKVSSDDKLWTSVIQLFLNQSDSFGKHYPKLSNIIVSEFWRIIICQVEDCLNHSGSLDLRLNVIVPLSIKWGLISETLPGIISGIEDFLSENYDKIDLSRIFESKDVKLKNQEAGLFCLFSLHSILKFNEARKHFIGNKSLSLLLGSLGKRIIEFYCRSSCKITTNGIVLQRCKELLIFIVNSITEEEGLNNILIMAMESITMANSKNYSPEFLISHFELLTTLMAFVTSSSATNRELIDKISGFEKQMVDFVGKLMDLNVGNEHNKKRIQQGMHIYIFGIRRLIGKSSIESCEVIEKLKLEAEKPV